MAQRRLPHRPPRLPPTGSCFAPQVGSYNSTQNVRIEDGAHFDINLRLPPYSLDRPLAVFYEASAPGPAKFMLLYSAEQLRQQDFAAMRLRCAFPQACPECP